MVMIVVLLLLSLLLILPLQLLSALLLLLLQVMLFLLLLLLLLLLYLHLSLDRVAVEEYVDDDTDFAKSHNIYLPFQHFSTKARKEPKKGKISSNQRNAESLTGTEILPLLLLQQQQLLLLLLKLIIATTIIIIIALKGANRHFYNLLTAQRTVSNTCAQVAKAQSCANHVQHI